MRYYGEEALGMVETLGMVPALEACDKMLKAHQYAAVKIHDFLVDYTHRIFVFLQMRNDILASQQQGPFRPCLQNYREKKGKMYDIDFDR